MNPWEDNNDVSLQPRNPILQDPTNIRRSGYCKRTENGYSKSPRRQIQAVHDYHEYIEQFFDNQRAWHELAELCINEHNYAKKTFV